MLRRWESVFKFGHLKNGKTEDLFISFLRKIKVAKCRWTFVDKNTIVAGYSETETTIKVKSPWDTCQITKETNYMRF